MDDGENVSAAGMEAPCPRQLHIPVLLEEVLAGLAPKENGRYLDGTTGLAGHSEAIITAAPGIELCCLDRDAQALALAAQRLAPFGDRVHFFQKRYSEFEDALEELGWEKIDGALIDIGVSSMQLDKPERGFSFLQEGPLDMRMDPEEGDSAEELVNTLSLADLRDILFRYGEDPQAGRIARAIVDARNTAPITTTTQLAEIVNRAYPAKWRATARNHPATRTFQALRMVVNNELGELERFMARIADKLAPGGRLCVITFHSLEDRIVKHSMREQAKDCICPPHVLRCNCGHIPAFKVLTKKPVVPDREEIRRNSRASSSKLRIAEKNTATAG